MTIVPGANGSANPAAAIAYHDTLAEGWARRYESGGFKRRAEFFTRDVLPKATISGKWLDVGCGSGVFSRMLAGAGAQVTGVDGSAAMIEAARAIPSSGASPRYQVETIETLARAGDGYDGALFLSVLEYLDDPRGALAAVAQRLRPGGLLILSAPNRRSGLRLLQRSLRTILAIFGSRAFPYLETSKGVWSRGELIALATGAGLTCEAVLGFDPVAPRSLWPLVSPSLWFLLCRKGD
jgi:2-polyprenyl-3-methyl-5-hydroxy-6-metoxy-1,4-benzoquinol methylase